MSPKNSVEWTGPTPSMAASSRPVSKKASNSLAFLESDEDTEIILAEDELARRLGVNGVPCFIIDRKYAVSGAQSPEVLVQVFDLANQESSPDFSK